MLDQPTGCPMVRKVRVWYELDGKFWRDELKVGQEEDEVRAIYFDFAIAANCAGSTHHEPMPPYPSWAKRTQEDPSMLAGAEAGATTDKLMTSHPLCYYVNGKLYCPS